MSTAFSFKNSSALVVSNAFGKVDQTFAGLCTCLLCNKSVPLKQMVTVCQVRQDEPKKTTDMEIPPCVACRQCAVNDKHVGGRADMAGNKYCKVCPLTIVKFQNIHEQMGKPLSRNDQSRKNVVVQHFQPLGNVKELELLSQHWTESKECVTAFVQNAERTHSKLAHKLDIAQKKLAGGNELSADERTQVRQEVIQEAAAEAAMEKSAAEAEEKEQQADAIQQAVQMQAEEVSAEAATGDAAVTSEEIFGNDDEPLVGMDVGDSTSVVGDEPAEQVVASSVAAAGDDGEAVVVNCEVAQKQKKKPKSKASGATFSSAASAAMSSKKKGKRPLPPPEPEFIEGEDEDVVTREARNYTPITGKKRDFQRWLKDKGVDLKKDEGSDKHIKAVEEWILKESIASATEAVAKRTAKEKLKDLPKLEAELAAYKSQVEDERREAKKAKTEHKGKIEKVMSAMEGLMKLCNALGVSDDHVQAIYTGEMSADAIIHLYKMQEAAGPSGTTADPPAADEADDEEYGGF